MVLPFLFSVFDFDLALFAWVFGVFFFVQFPCSTEPLSSGNKKKAQGLCYLITLGIFILTQGYQDV